jgi:hypothetical protein
MKTISLTLCALLLTALTFAQTSRTSHTSSESTTISITNSDLNYSLTAAFGAAKKQKLKTLLTDALGKPLTATEDLSLWSSKNIYTVTLKAQKLTIDMDKDKATGSLIRTFVGLGDSIQNVLSTPKSSPQPAVN